MSFRKSIFAAFAVCFLPLVYGSNVVAQKPTLITVQSGDVAAGSGLSEDPVVSANGRFVAFEGFSFNLVPVGVNSRKNIFHRDLQTGITRLISVNLAGTGGGNLDSRDPAISADGRYVAFESGASNLVANDNNNSSQIFVHDVQTGITTLVSVNSAGTGGGNNGSFSPTMSANGRVIVFQSFASNLSTIDTNNRLDVFARDLQTGTTHLVSCNVGCTASGNNDSVTSNVPKDKAPRANVSNDGRVVVFESRATNLVTIPMAPGGFTEVFARDLQAGTTTLLSVNMQGTMSVGGGTVPVISGDGRFAVFQSSSPNITPNDSGSGLDLFRRDLQTGATTMVTTTIANTGSNGPSNFGYFPIVSTDGRYITFQSNAQGYVANDLNNRFDAFRRDMETNTTVLISGTTGGGTGPANDALGAVMSSDGRYVAFICSGTDFVSIPDTNNRGDVCLRDVNAGTTTLLSTNMAGTSASNSGADYPVISADGRFTFFESSSIDMVPNTVTGTSIFGVANQGRAQFNLNGLSVSETESTATFGITRTDTSGALTVQFAASNGTAAPGADFSTAPGSVTFADGEATKNIVIQLNNDTIDEFNETVLLTLSDFNATGQSAGSLSATILTLTDDDTPPSISINDATVVEGNSGFPVHSFTLTLSAVSGKPITVNLTATAGTATETSDYGSLFGLVTVPAGVTSHPINFQVVGDTVHEDDETFTVSLSDPGNVTIDRATATITIQNDDPIPGITINDVTLAESNSGTRSFFFTIRLSNASSKQVSVQVSTADSSAQVGTDYAGISGTLTFTPGSTVRFVPVLVNGDPVVENDEQFFVNLTNPTEATLVDSQGVGAIQNDDLPPVLLLEENTQRAAALELTTWLRDPFPLVRAFNFGPDPRTRISLFALNLTLIAGEDSSAVEVSAEDNIGFVHSLQVESVSVVPNEPSLSQIIVRLPDSVGNSNELKLKVTLRGQTSNVGVIRIATP